MGKGGETHLAVRFEGRFGFRTDSGRYSSVRQWRPKLSWSEEDLGLEEIRGGMRVQGRGQWRAQLSLFEEDFYRERGLGFGAEILREGGGN